MICPKCNSEYREGFSVCSDCNVALAPSGEVIDEQKPPNLIFPAIAIVLGTIAGFVYYYYGVAHGLPWYVPLIVLGFVIAFLLWKRFVRAK